MALLLAAGLAAPAMAAKIDNSGGTPATTVAPAGDIDFGDDTSEWANDGECDDPRFSGTGSAAETLDADILKDATDCKAAYDAGTVTFVDGGDAPVATTGAVEFGDDSSEWANDGECDDPRFSGTGSAAETLDADILKDATDCKAAYDAGTVTFDGGDAPVATIAAVEFGDDSSEWANDGECDDPRFSGTGSAAETLEADILKDATDCKAAYDAGTVTFVEGGDTPVATAAVDFGDDTSEWANDGECDDPRFQGTGSAAETLDADILKDATDCKAAYDAGTVTFVGDDAPVDVADIDYGDDTSEWSNDGECDDPRFTGTGVAETLLEADQGHDATDCRAAVEAGTATFNGGTTSVDYGNDTAEWANDGECDDPRFSGTGVADEPLQENIGRDATDCQAAVEAGTATFNGGAATTPVGVFDYGSDFSKWANDGECDDLRFAGEGVDKKLLLEDMQGDATDCKALEAEGKVTIKQVYTPEYAAGGPYSTAGISFGDNSSSYANDGQCDDPRFEGPGTASTLLDGDLEHDSVDCIQAYEAGTIVLR
ncbi:hypothetical protein [Devosia sp. SL43]|uniref:hypothetical protein n=1 Tax=Devosia sp. SL43 TaxID=2806348 RepID=UPI001F35707B|nr:hypothetical protein [Devosia sp. SL43]UJW84170.1 hypothetical protein IM737_12050 [Devosia sp. SL43]